jgi:hypothetical protein
MHVYLVIDCRTPDCKTLHVVKYLGENSKYPGLIPVTIPSPFLIHCPNCELDHDYNSDHVYQKEFPHAPPSDYTDKI